MSVFLGKFKTGFSLIEINLVLFIVGVALVSLMGLFPVGLREADASASDTEQALFAERALNAILAKASAMTNYTDWADTDKFVDGLERGKKLLVGDVSGGLVINSDKSTLVNEYLGVRNSFLRYKVEVDQINSGDNMNFPDDDWRFERLYKASIWVTNRKNGNPEDNTPYVTYIFYKGAM